MNDRGLHVARLVADSPAALAKAQDKQTKDGFSVHRVRTLLSDLRSIARNSVPFRDTSMEITTTPTALHQWVFDLLKSLAALICCTHYAPGRFSLNS
jgi:hypothetical protein